MPVTQDEPQTVLVITALDAETKAVLRHVGKGWTEEVEYYRGKFENWDVGW